MNDKLVKTAENVSAQGDQEYLRDQLKISQEEYMSSRVHFKMKNYDKLGNRHRWFYYISSFVSIVCAATVPVLIAAGERYKLEATILSLLVTILVSLEKLFHFREHWRNYDSIASHLRNEQLLFQTKSGVYDEKETDDDAFKLFVKRIEEGIKSEREQTIEMRTKEMPK